MDKRIVIGLIGEKGSGKGTVAKYLAAKYGASHFGTSRILRRTLEDLKLPITRDNLIKLALVLKEGFWPSVVIDSMITDIEESEAALAIADGIRMHGDVEPFTKKYGERFHLLYVTAPIQTRFERTRQRKEKDGEFGMTMEKFLAEETRLTELSIHEIGAQATYCIDNTGDYNSLTAQVDAAMDKILKLS